MAPNRFATMLHRNTNKITLILIYAVLEWMLIFFLLLNSLFSFLIIKFAEYFGLKPPCLWCTRIDHIFDPAKGSNNMHRNLLCEAHRKEISRLGYCSSHRKLVESQEMCEDCFSSRPDFQGSSKSFAVFPWMKGFGVLQTVGENGGVILKCSCCGVCLDNGIYSSYALLKTSSWDALERTHKENLITFDDDEQAEEGGDDSSAHENVEIGGNLGIFECVSANLNEPKLLEAGDDVSYEKIPDSSTDENVEIHGNFEVDEFVSANSNEPKLLEAREDELDLVLEVERENELMEEDKSILIMKDESVQVCIEEDAQPENPPQHLEFFLDYNGHTLVPIELTDSMADEHRFKENDMIEGDDEIKDQDFVPDSEVGVEEREPLIAESGSRIEKVYTFLDIDINEEPTYAMLEAMEMEEDENRIVFHAKDSNSVTIDQFDSFPLACWASLEASEDDVACEEASDTNNENEEDVSIGTEIPDLYIADGVEIQDSTHADPSTSSANLYEVDDHVTKVEEQIVELELQSLSVENRERMWNEIEEDKFPDTPTSIDSLNHLHKKRDSMTEESLDGSVTSELDCNHDGVVSVERLKAALRAERKTLQALYAELEEERSASAVAANQTMAMINRLQEEKAAMQMEALQYQRMMEEQSEYDQEALQLLNELMVKREKEKQEMERELDGYRKREKIRARSGSSSASCSEESDGLSIDLNQEAKEEVGFYNTPLDAVVNLEQSLADFEDERVSLLEQLKFLEEKLSTLDDHENGHLNGEANGHANGFSQEVMNKKQRQKGKSLLPLFDAICDENGDAMVNGNGVDCYESELVVENKKVAIEEEVDHLYERLQALEADREFLKHCIRSLKKGDKGMDLLQEILQHLRDLRNVELRVTKQQSH